MDFLHPLHGVSYIKKPTAKNRIQNKQTCLTELKYWNCLQKTNFAQP